MCTVRVQHFRATIFFKVCLNLFPFDFYLLWLYVKWLLLTLSESIWGFDRSLVQQCTAIKEMARKLETSTWKLPCSFDVFWTILAANNLLMNTNKVKTKIYNLANCSSNVSWWQIFCVLVAVAVTIININ